jgi:hypothetical protein
MKKIILGLATVGILATGLSADDTWDFVKNDKAYFCKQGINKSLADFVNNEFDEDICNGGQQGYIHLKASAESIETIANQRIGTFSNELLSNKGVGVKLTKGWQNIDFNYNSFMCSLSKTDRSEIFKFYLSAIKNKSSLPQKDFSYLLLNDIKLSKAPEVRNYLFIENIATNKNKAYKEEYTNRLFELIIREKYSEAINFVKEVNRKSGYTKIFNDMETACKDNSNETIFDMYKSTK